MKLGNVISKVATPIARAMDLPCIDPVTQNLRPDSRCAQRRDALNRFSDSIFDRFFSSNNTNEKGNKMQFIVTIAVEAETVEEALQKKNEGKTLSVNPRPQPLPQKPQGIGTPVK